MRLESSLGLQSEPLLQKFGLKPETTLSTMQWDTLNVRHFDLAATLDSGQVFHWHRDGEMFCGMIGNEPVSLQQRDAETLLVSQGSGPLVSHYLGLDHDFAAIRKTLPKRDKPLQQALKYAPGLRILRQPKWECLATFITSSLKQVPHIRKISLTLRARFGEPVRTTEHDIVLYSYPTPHALAQAGEKALRECGLGYRAKFLHLTAKRIVDGEMDLEKVGALDDEAACEALCLLPGVGEKIANCVLLFGYGRLGAFPIDVWIERALREFYFAGSMEVTSRQLREFAHEHFGPYRGYAQQWLFHHARTSGLFTKR